MPDENDSGVAAPPKRSIATGGRLRSAPGRSRLLPRRLYERLGEFLFQQGEIALYAAGAADEHMVRALDAQCWQKRAGQRAKTALHAVADNRPADLLGEGDAKTNGRSEAGRGGKGCVRQGRTRWVPYHKKKKN